MNDKHLNTQTITMTATSNIVYEMAPYDPHHYCTVWPCKRRFKTEQGLKRHQRDYHR
jgi:hypothetical protein